MDTICRIPETVHSVDAETETEVEIDDKTDRKTRRCLMCGQPFLSEWAGERVCRSCKSTAAWRTG
ncbi:MAG: hypothetical protein RBS99_02370 [Rhodospirillales bacterium]|jgi:hypothetical protein|nr:hypothetical protein [Rhodospirillales bacterium]